MKAILFSLVALVMTFSIPAFAQRGKTNTQKLSTLWLQNGEGQEVKASNDTIPRSFFLVKEVSIHSSRPLKDEECFMVVLQPSDGSQPKAYSFTSTTFSIPLRAGLEKAPPGTLISFHLSQKNVCYPAAAAYPLQLVLGK